MATSIRGDQKRQSNDYNWQAEIDALLADKTRLATLQIPDPLGGGRMHDRVNAAELLKQRIGQEWRQPHG